jgi:hypothetical protein
LASMATILCLLPLLWSSLSLCSAGCWLPSIALTCALVQLIVLVKLAAETVSFQCAGGAVLACAAPIPETILVRWNKCLLPEYRRLPGDGCCHSCAGRRLHIGSRLALGLPDHHAESQHRQDQHAELVSLYHLHFSRLCSTH